MKLTDPNGMMGIEPKPLHVQFVNEDRAPKFDDNDSLTIVESLHDAQFVVWLRRSDTGVWFVQANDGEPNEYFSGPNAGQNARAMFETMAESLGV